MTRPGTDLTDVRTHFEFGKNWAEYADLIDQERLAAAIENVRSLVPRVAGKSFLDIGSGSGLFSLAALHLGAARVLAIDLDKDSVATTRKVLASQAENGRWTAERRSVFELSPDDLGRLMSSIRGVCSTTPATCGARSNARRQWLPRRSLCLCAL